MTQIKRKAVDVLDGLTTNPWTAFPIFIVVVYFMFWCTFALGQYPMDWIQAGVDWLMTWLDGHLSDCWLKDMLVDGVIAGAGGVVVFLPNIVILYFLISIMESTGYMGRVAFIMDKIMHHMGLHGKSFIPIIMGFGCNVPAIMATRDIQNPKNRLVTILVIPFMSCGGRLPVYLLLIAAFFPQNGPLVMLGIYALGMCLAVVAAKILSLILPGKSEHDNVEIRTYTRPDMHYVLANTREQAREYIKKLAGPILVFSVALWLAGYFPRAVADDGQRVSPAQQMEQSFIGQVGKAMDPVLEPVGMNWKDGVAIVAGVGAKELIVSTLGVMYSTDGEDGLRSSLHASHTPAGALAFMVFVLLYFPCIGTFVALKNATGKWGWAIGSCVHNIVLAWVMAWITFTIFSL